MNLDTITPPTTKHSLNNILSSLNIAQEKGVFSLRESAIIFTSLQKLNEFVNKYENEEIRSSQISQVQSSTIKPTVPEIYLNEEIIEI